MTRFRFPWTKLFSAGFLAGLVLLTSTRPAAAWISQSETANMDRTVLPIVEPAYDPIKTLDARDAQAPPRFEVKAPKGAPNVVVVLIDDMGFGQPSTFGGGCQMPTLDKLASHGLRYTNMHVTALCSPSRAALLSGRNHHSCNVGAVEDVATAFPGNTGVRPNSVAPLAQMLSMNGYNTAAFGKWHLAPLWETSVSGPFVNWPTGSGFEKFYGFLGGETNQWAPLIYDGVTKVELPHDPNYHFMSDMTDQAINWTRFQHAITPDKPFFMYFAPGATHAPHHCPPEWSAKYKGKFDRGWDAYREATLARQKELGLVPPNTKLPPKPPGIKDWDGLTPDEQKLFARQMEVFAGFAEYADAEVGRLVGALEDIGVMDNTLFVYIAGDNGSSAEGGMVGTFNELTYFNGVPQTLQAQLDNLPNWGGPETYPHFAAGWAIAGNTPFAWSKQVASDFGGTKNGMVVHWPKGIQPKGEVRRQWHHLIDLAPTIMEAARLPFPKSVNGVAQLPFAGVSMGYSFNDSQAKDRHITQYFEIAGNRAIYHQGWLARTIHKSPWEAQPKAKLDQDNWELFDTNSDFSLANNLAQQNPELLTALQQLFLEEAIKYNVLPIDDRSIERLNPAIAGRPDLMSGRTTLTLSEGMTGMMENTFINLKNRSFEIRAEVEVPGGDSQGVIVAQGGRFGGWTLFLDQGKPAFTYNFVGLERSTVTSPSALSPGRSEIMIQFDYEGGGPGRGGNATLTVNGKKAGQVNIPRTTANIFSTDEGADVGLDADTPVSEAYQAGESSKFQGKIRDVTIQLK